MSSSCPGFKPHGVKPTRCRRCFKEYSEHQKNEDPPKPLNKPILTKSVSKDEDTNKNVESVEPKNTADANDESKKSVRNRSSLESSSAVPSSGDEKNNGNAKFRVRTRTGELQIPDSDSPAKQEPASSTVRRTRVRPSSIAETQPEQSSSATSSAITTSLSPEINGQSRRTRVKEQRLEPDGAELSEANKSGAIPKTKSVSPKRIKIIGTEEVESNGKNSSESGDKTSADVEFILRVKTATPYKDYDNDSIAGTETTETTLVGIDAEEYQSKIASLTMKLEESEEKIKILETDKTDLQKQLKKQEKLKENKAKVSDSDKQALEKTAGEVLKLRNKMRDLESANTELKDENNVLRIEVKELNSEVNALKKDNPKELKETITNLRLKLQQTEHICEELVEENDEIKRDVKALEEEFQELHDNFREDQTSEFRVLKRELESTSKNCRVLQFKLKKAERSVEILENEKVDLEKKVKDLVETSKLDFDKKKMKELETEFTIAKEVSLKLHADIETLKEEKQSLEQQLIESFSKSKVLSPSAKASNRLSPAKLSPSVSLENKDYEAVVRDLYDTMEREKDLQEQLKFAEEESRTMRKKLSTMEQENEILMMQIRKMAIQNKKKNDKNDADDDSEELSPEEMKLHLELYEQEMVVLRKKTDELEQENENFQQEIKYLQEKLISQPLAKVEIPQIPEGSPPNVIYEHKIRMLEVEARELRKKLVEREKENESLRTEIDVHRRKASKVMVRSRSLDSEQQVDLKRQLQLVEQEAGILRLKIVSLENENEKLMAENKRFQLRLSRKPPPGPADQLQIENIELKQKLTDLERKCENFKGELFASKSQTNLSGFLIHDRSSRKDSISDIESDVINTLKKQVKTKEEETTILNTKMAQLELECARVNCEYKKLKETINYRKGAPRTLRETATRGELKDIIRELEEEINALHRTLKANEVINENIQEELSETKREMENMQSEFRNKDAQNYKNIESFNCESEKLRKEIENEQKKTKSLQSKVDMMMKEKGTDCSVLDKIEILQAEKKVMAIKCDDLEMELKREKCRADDYELKFNNLNKLKTEMSENAKASQKQKEKLEDECDANNERVKKLEILNKEFKVKCDKLEKETLSLRNETVTLKNEISHEKSKLLAIDSRASGVTASSALIQKENSDLKKQIQEMKNKSEMTQNLLEKSQKEFIDKENALKDEHLKKVETAVRDVRKEIHIEMQSLREEITGYKNKLSESNEKIEKSNREFKELNEKIKNVHLQHRKEKDEITHKLSDYELQIRNEQKKREKIEKELEMAVKSKDDDTMHSKERIVQLEREHRRVQTRLEGIEYEYKTKITNFDRELTKERQEYDDLTNKYEFLEHDFVDIKSRLTKEKDTLVEAVSSIKKSYDEKLTEIKSLKETLSSNHETAFREKYEMQEKMSELQTKLSRLGGAETERNRLKDMLIEKENLLESYRKEEKHIKEDRDRLRRKCDEISGKLSDMERLERSARTMTITGKTQAEKELHECRIRIDHSEAAHKGDIASLHAEYEGRMKLMGDEINELQRQIAMLADERDRYKDQLTRDPSLRLNSRAREDFEDMNAQMRTLRDNLESALLENRNLKIQNGTDRSTYQIQMAEMRTKINQFEERILLETRGSTRNYAKTKMELAWDKERSEQQKLLQDTQKFITEMREKLINNETMREKERHDARRQLQDLKEIMDKEQEDTQKKIGELQLDLVDLRESHAKIRSQNERLRRERSVYEKEREDSKLLIFAAIDIQNKVTDVISEFEEIAKLVPPEEEKKVIEPKETGQTEVKKVSRKASTRVNVTELRNGVEKVKGKIEELKSVSVPLKDDDRLRRAVSFRAAVSASELSSSSTSLPRQMMRVPFPPPNVIRAPPRPKALAKKSISLDQTIGMSGYRGASQEKIWESGDSAATTPTSSISNLRTIGGPYRGFSSYTGYESESSIGAYSSRWTRDGSLGEGSDTSAPVVVKHKKSLKEKLGITKKTQSIEGVSSGITHAGLTSLAVHGLEPSPFEMEKERKKKENSLKSKISKTLSKTFSKSSTTLQLEKPQSPERTGPKVEMRPLRDSSTQRPLSAVISPSTFSQTLRPSSPDSGVTTKGEKGTKKSIFGRSIKKEETVVTQSPSSNTPSPQSKTLPRIRPETTV